MEDKDASLEQTEGQIKVLDHGPAKKEAPRTNVNINIRYVDKHFLASFNHSHS